MVLNVHRSHKAGLLGSDNTIIFLVCKDPGRERVKTLHPDLRCAGTADQYVYALV